MTNTKLLKAKTYDWQQNKLIKITKMHNKLLKWQYKTKSNSKY